MASVASPSTSIVDAAKSLQDWIVARRRHLHERPELSFGEVNTSAFVEAELKALGIAIKATRVNGNYSLCADLPGRDSSRVIALRADMDALPIQEETESPFKSKTAGVSHMCGHDAHTTMLLGAARLLRERQGELPCNVRLLFQGGEEKFPGGARDFIEAGFLRDVDMVFGLHVDPRHDVGTFHLSEGRALAGVSEFTLTVHGLGGHAAYPHATRDPILASAHVLTALQQIVSRRIDPFEPGVVSICTIHGGSAFNVIPSEVAMNGTVRSFRSDAHARYKALIEEVAGNVAAGFGCTVSLNMPEGYPPLINEPKATERLTAAAAEVMGASSIHPWSPMMGSEDFALYTRETAASFAFLGVASPEDRDRYMLHHPKFKLNEDALWRGAAVLATVAMRGV